MGRKSSRSSGSSTSSYSSSSSGSSSSSSSSSRTNSSKSTDDTSCTVTYTKIPKSHSRTLSFMAFATGAPYRPTAIKKRTTSSDWGSLFDYSTELYWVTGYRPESPPSFVDRGRSSASVYPPEDAARWQPPGPRPGMGLPPRGGPAAPQGRAPGPSFPSGPATGPPFVPTGSGPVPGRAVPGNGPAFAGPIRTGVPGPMPRPRPHTHT